MPAATPVAYFCAEYGLEPDLPFFAGGLGVLAGDVVKAAADAGQPFVGVGLFYHGKGDRQTITPEGWQINEDYHFDPEAHELYPVYDDDQPFHIEMPLRGETAHVYALEKRFGPDTVVYFLETDRDSNPQPIRDIVKTPYCCSEADQISQQIILGIGGYRLLRALDIEPSIFHLNEGRPAWVVWEIACCLKREHPELSGRDALLRARQKVVYTNHTLVRAGNVSYPIDLVKEFAQPFAQELEVPVEVLTDMGVDADPTRFEITTFALNASARASGVSRRHTSLSQEQWPNQHWVNITNGVHMNTWQKPEFRQNLSDEQLWKAHRKYKHQLAEFAFTRAGYSYDPNRFVVGWARRIADYKRLDSLFIDLERLVRILKHAERPVQLLVAGKAHPGDQSSKELLQWVIQRFQNELMYHALFIPDYDIGLAQHMVSGVDLWVNTPVDGREACGTSGMKASANGVLQATVADGWAAEVMWDDIGWLLDGDDPGHSWYNRMENEIVPLFYERDAHGIPHRWIERMRRGMEVANRFSAARMLREYNERLYHVASEGAAQMPSQPMSSDLSSQQGGSKPALHHVRDHLMGCVQR